MAVVQAMLDGPEDPDSMSLLREWTMYLEAEGKSPITIRTYSEVMMRFLSFKPKPIRDHTETDVIEWLASYSKHAPARALYSASLRSFFTWALRRGFVRRNPLEMLKFKPPARHDPRCFTEEEVQSLALAAHTRDPRRGSAILACYATGARRGEFCALRPQDLDFDAGFVNFMFTKGDRPRQTEMGKIARQAFAELAPYPGERVVGVGPKTFSKWVWVAAIDLGFPEGRRNAHMLRASFATHMLNRGVPVHVVSRLLGHSDIKITTRYSAVNDNQRRAAVDLL